MAREESIVNKIIPIDTIIEVANYLENQKEEYSKLFEIDQQKNKDLKYDEQVYEYKELNSKTEYTIRFKDGKEVTKSDYDWFINMLSNPKIIEHITIYAYEAYSSNIKDKTHYEYMYLHTWLHFYEESASIRVDGKNTEEQVYRNHSYLKGVIENNEERYNKTVKNRKLRVQCFCLSIGFIMSYIIYFILNGIKIELPEIVIYIINNKYALIVGQWCIAVLIGNLLGFPIMKALYKNIIPKAKYSHYSRSSHKFIYVDNIEDYTSKNEVQIGKFVNNGNNRVTIEKIYKITSKMVLIQLVISVLLCIILT